MNQSIVREDVWENMISRNLPDEDFEIVGPAIP